MRERLKEKIQKIEELMNNPFNPYPLEEAFQDLIKDLKDLSQEEAKELYQWLNKAYARLEENYKIALGWLEELAKEEKRGEIRA